jgi:hypothetical protein
MKKSILTLATALTLMFIGSNVNAQNGNNDQNLIGKARGAAHDCLTPYRSQGIDIAAGVETTGICFVSGSLHKVVFYTTVRCHSEPCPRPASVLVATVYFDCDNNVTSVECAN